MKTWNIGNTTVRNPTRLRKALILFDEKMSGRPFGRPQQIEFQGHMIKARLVESERFEGDDGARKFGSALKQLGFVTDWSNGKLWEVTEVGKQLIENPNIEPNIFLRQLLKYQIPSPLERKKGFSLRPFRMFLKFLYRAYHENMMGLTKLEIGLFVITLLSEKEDEFEDAFSKLRAFRSRYQRTVGRVRKGKLSKENLQSLTYKSGLEYGTPKDYADSTSRYALLTGLLTLKGNKIAISDSNLEFVGNLLADGTQLLSDGDYIEQFYDPTLPVLPSDDLIFLQKETSSMITEIEALAKALSEAADIPEHPPRSDLLKLQEYEQRLRQELLRLRELQFYHLQRTPEALSEIEELLVNIKEGNLFGGEVYAPAYFEWAIWRLFLAINHIEGSISETRGFRVDQDIQPIHHAKSRSADLSFKYRDFILVCEMTLLTGSTQFVKEGEPVQRHISRVIQQNKDKPVYGLFIAKKVDPNTAKTFYRASYLPDWESEIVTPVIPMDIEHALGLVRTIQKKMITIGELKKVFEDTLAKQDEYPTGSAWYSAYSKNLVEQFERSR